MHKADRKTCADWGAVRSISICILTHRRYNDLEKLLKSIENLEMNGVETVSCEVVIVDNETDGPLGESLKGRSFRFPLRYVTQPERNISLSRNIALDIAVGDVIVFLDDDQEVHPSWMTETIKFSKELPSNVAGYIMARRYLWRESGSTHRFFPLDKSITYKDRYPRAGALTWQETRTGGCAVYRHVVIHHNVRFDPKFGLTGGGDQKFFQILIESGYQIVGCPDVVVFEHIELSRMSLAAILSRRYAHGMILPDLHWHLSPASRLRLGAKSVLNIARHLPMFMVFLMVDRKKSLQALENAAYWSGALLGVVGFRYALYKRKG